MNGDGHILASKKQAVLFKLGFCSVYKISKTHYCETRGGIGMTPFFFFFFFLFLFLCSHYNCYHVSLVPAFSKCPKFALFVTKFTQDGYICHVSYSHTGCGLTFYPQHK